jgi:hypothetical protein
LHLLGCCSIHGTGRLILAAVLGYLIVVNERSAMAMHRKTAMIIAQAMTPYLVRLKSAAIAIIGSPIVSELPTTNRNHR